MTQKGKLCLKKQASRTKRKKKGKLQWMLKKRVQKTSFNGFQRQVSALRQDPTLLFFEYQLIERRTIILLWITKERVDFLELWKKYEGKTGISSNIDKRQHSDAIKHILVVRNRCYLNEITILASKSFFYTVFSLQRTVEVELTPC